VDGSAERRRMELQNLQRDIRALRAMVVAMLGLCAVVLLGAVTIGSQQSSFDEITVHRINVMDREGNLAMVLASHDDEAVPVILGRQGRRAQGNNADNGIIFFNQKGDEQGGLIWSTMPDRQNSGDTLSFDTAQTDQLLQLDDGSADGKHYAYLVGWDRAPNDAELGLKAEDELQTAKTDDERKAILAKYQARGLAAPRRFLLGYDLDDAAQLSLADKDAHPRIKMFVTRDGEAKLQFLDGSGRVTYQLPPSTP
jgi:hypothetical protein